MAYSEYEFFGVLTSGGMNMERDEIDIAEYREFAAALVAMSAFVEPDSRLGADSMRDAAKRLVKVLNELEDADAWVG